MLAEVHRVDTLVLSVAQFSTDAGYAGIDTDGAEPGDRADRRGRVDLCEITTRPTTLAIAAVRRTNPTKLPREVFLSSLYQLSSAS